MNQPKLYCSLTDHSPLSSRQSPNHSAATNKRVIASASGNGLRRSGEASVSLCGVARFCTGEELTKFARKANRECRFGKLVVFRRRLAVTLQSGLCENAVLRNWRLTQTPYNGVTPIVVRCWMFDVHFYGFYSPDSRHPVLQRRC